MQEHRVGKRNDIAARLRRADLRPPEHDVRKAILTAFAHDGTALSVEALAQALGLPLASVCAACRTLAASDLILWQEETTHSVSAYPFSGVPTVHQVQIGGHTTLYAMCAIDALGIPFMLGQGASIRSTCFVCHTPVTVDIDGSWLHRADPSTIVVWSSEREGSCVAEVRCPLMNFFCHEGHLQAWRVTAPHERGTSLSLADALEVGQAAFGALLTDRL